jgi:hypothetical protein
MFCTPSTSVNDPTAVFIVVSVLLSSVGATAFVDESAPLVATANALDLLTSNNHVHKFSASHLVTA